MIKPKQYIKARVWIFVRQLELHILVHNYKVFKDGCNLLMFIIDMDV